jgi:nitroreductase
VSANADARPDKRVRTRYDVLPVFVERWSPRSFLARAPSPEQLRSMFEAARLAPSAHNTQPPRFILTEKGRGDGHARLFDCLDPHNQVWAHAAPVLVLALVMRQRFSQAEARFVPYPHCMHDLGLSVMSLILQAVSLGLSCHPLAAFDPDRARALFEVPDLFEPGLVIAVGYRGSPDCLPDALRQREVGPRTRRPVEELVFEGRWGEPSSLFADGDA